MNQMEPARPISKPVFISYARRSSKEFAYALNSALIQTHQAAFLDTEDIAHGEQFPQKISDALLSAKVFVVFLDSIYFTRWLCLRELRTALAPFDAKLQSSYYSREQLDATLRHIVIALPEGAENISVLENLPATLRVTDWPKASETDKLVDLICSRLTDLTTSIGEQLESAEGRTLREMLLSETALPSPKPLIHPHFPRTFPPSLHDRFVGRADDLFRVQFALSTVRGEPAHSAALTGAIQGGGGFGKTRLALEYVWRFGPSYYPGGLFWLTADQDRSGLDRQFHGMLRELRPETPEIHQFRQQARNAKNELGEALIENAHKQPVLFVVDNLPEANEDSPVCSIEEYCPAIGAVTVLVTSRSRIAESYVRALPVDVLQRSSSIALLTEGTGVRKNLSESEWAKIAEWVGDLPLALEVLNSALKFRSISPRELLAKCYSESVTKAVDRQMKALRGQVPKDSLRGVTEALGISYDVLPLEVRRAARLLAWLAAEPIPLELFSAFGSEMNRPEVRAALVGHSILSYPGEVIYNIELLGTMHRVMADYIRVRVRTPGAELERICNAVSSVMTPHRCADPSQWPMMNLCLPHADGLFLRATAEFTVVSPSAGGLQSLFARALRRNRDHKSSLAAAIVSVGRCSRDLRCSQCLYSDAVEYATATSQFAEKVCETNSDTILWARLALADVLRHTNQVATAKLIEEEVMRLSLQQFGEENELTVAAMNNLGVTLIQEKKWKEAKEIIEKVVKIDQQLYGLHHRESITAMHNLAGVFHGQGNTMEARLLEERVLELYRGIQGEGHPDTLRAMAFLALWEPDKKRRREMQKKVFALYEQYCGLDHEDTLKELFHLAQNHYDEGDLTDARIYFNKLLTARRRLSGKDHAETLAALYKLALACRELKDYQTALPLFIELVEKLRYMLGPDHTDTLSATNHLGLTYYYLKDYHAARPLFQETLRSWTRLVAADHPDRLSVLRNLALTYYNDNNYNAAQPLFTELLELRTHLWGDDNENTLDTLEDLALTYYYVGNELENYQAAQPLFAELLDRRRRLNGNDHLNTELALKWLARTYYDMNEYEAAKPLFEELLRLRQRVFGPEHPRTLDAIYFLATSCLELGELGITEQLLRKAMDLQRKVLGAKNTETLTSMSALGRALLELGRLEEAKAILQTVLELRQRVLGPEHWQTGISCRYLGRVCDALGDSRAHHLLQEALRVHGHKLAVHHRQTVFSAWNLFEYLNRYGEMAAQEVFERHLAWMLGKPSQEFTRDLQVIREKVSEHQNGEHAHHGSEPP
jgi:tetratricopeptide (TPR) repeat protein